jgi:hypothetical protein
LTFEDASEAQEDAEVGLYRVWESIGDTIGPEPLGDAKVTRLCRKRGFGTSRGSLSPPERLCLSEGSKEDIQGKSMSWDEKQREATAHVSGSTAQSYLRGEIEPNKNPDVEIAFPAAERHTILNAVLCIPVLFQG